MDKELFNQQRVKIVGVHHIVPELVHNDEDEDELYVFDNHYDGEDDDS